MSSNSNDELERAIIRIVREEKPDSVQQLVNLLQQRLKLPENQSLAMILELQNQGAMLLERQPLPPPPDLKSYLKTSQASWYHITVTLATLTLITVFLIPENLQPLSYIRNILGTIFVLCLPGFTFIKTLFPIYVPVKTSSENLDTVERIALSIGMSLALAPLVGLLLNYTPWGIRLTPVMLGLFALTLIFATAAIIREHQAKTKPEKQT